MNKWTPEQEEAIYKSGSNIIVSAGAGSGKTAVLSERVINKLNEGIHINELLILTFTNAAANEMKDRIRKKISKDNNLKKELELLTSSYITTFDSFALSVLRKYHYILNISNDISISDESIVRLEEERIIDSIFDELYVSKDESFLNLISNYCNKNDKKLRDNILRIARKINSNINSLEYIDKIKNEFFTSDYIDKIIDEYNRFIKDKKRVIKLEIDNLSYYFDSQFVLKMENACKELLDSNTNDLHLFSAVKLPNVPSRSSEEAKSAKNNIKLLIDKLLNYSKYGDYEQIKSSIMGCKDNIYSILNIVEKYIELLNQYKKENNIYTFNDVAYLSIKILKENKSIREEIKNSFKEIMIDEYQDTNDVQDTFINLISNNNVYMVGDIKQSIYKFRGSNPNIFKDKYENYSNNNGGIKIDLVKNFRSRDEVVNNINSIFDLLMDNTFGGANYKLSHRMVFGNKDYELNKIDNFKYNIDIFEYENDSKDYTNTEIEIFKIANDIKEKMTSHIKVYDKDLKTLRDITYNDFVIILDRSAYFTDYKKVFEYMGIPLTILKDEVLNANSDVLLIKNIIDFVIRINNNDFDIDFKYDFVSIARSFLYEYSDNEIFDIFTSGSFKETSIYKDLSTIDNINSMTSSDILERVLEVTKFYDKINKIGEYEEVNVRLNNIYNIASSINSLGYDINDFILYLDNIINKGIEIKYSAYNSSSDSVKIMTIHKSKGLEFPICYFADIDHDFNTRELKDEFIVSNNYGLIVPYENENSIIKELYKREFLNEEISEKLRLFYVALTRAREKIIIVLPYKDTKKLEKNENGVIDEIRRQNIKSISDFIYYIKDYLIDYFSSVDINKLGLSKQYLFKKKIDSKFDEYNKDLIVNEITSSSEVIDNTHFSKETSFIISKNEYDVMKYGTKVHEILEYLDFKNINLDSIKDKFIVSKIKSLINNEIFKNIKDAKIYKEYEFNYIKDNIEYNGIIDLLLEYDNYIDIVDYKLKDINDERYINQLNGYKNYIESISDKKVNLYLYSIMDEKIKSID